jgi:hypothetical protein
MALKEILAKFGFEVDSKPLDKADKKAEGLAKRIITTFAAAEIVGAMRGFVNEMFDLEGSITDTSDALGISRQSFQEWSYIASRGGASADDMATAMKVLQKNAASGSEAFKKLGVDIKGADGQIKPVESLMGDVATALSEVKNPAERTQLALELLGKGGSKLNAVFAKGPEAIAELRKRFVELGGGLTEEALDSIGAAADAMDDVELASRSLKGSLMVVLAPALRSLTNGFASVISYFNKGENAATRMKSAIIVLGAAGAAAGAAMLAPYLPFIIALAAAYLIVQDFYTFLEGGDSVTGKVIEWLFGEGSAEEVKDWIKGIQDKLEDLRKDMEKKPGGGTVWDYIEEGFSQAGENIVKFFMDDIPEAVGFAAKSIAQGTGSFGEWLLVIADSATGVSTFTDAVKKIQTIGPMIVTFLEELGTKIIETAKGVGKNIVDGIVAGFTIGEPKLIAGGAAAGLAALKGVNKGAGNRSPSVKGKKAATDIVAGTLIGLAEGLPQIERMGLKLGAAGIPKSMSKTINVQQQNSMHFNVAAPHGGMIGAMRSSMANGLADERGALADALAIA